MPPLIYDRLSRIYDDLWSSVSLRYLPIIKSLLKERIILQGRILDLACGTGTLISHLAKDGHIVFGLDISEKMIRIAKTKVTHCDNVFLSVQDMTSIGFNEQFNAVLCTYDSLNYITSESALLQMFQNISNIIDPEGFFLFDFNSENQYESSGDSQYISASQSHDFILRQSYIPQLQMATSIFQFRDGGMEVHKQRSYSLQQIKALLHNADLKLIESFSSGDDARFSLRDQRTICIASR